MRYQQNARIKSEMID